MSTPLQLAGVIRESIVDGPGIRFVVFAQGCPHHCVGCQNAQTWPFTGGNDTLPEKVVASMQENPLLAGLTLSGGEPFCQCAAMADLAAQAKQAGYSVWVYTGYTWEELIARVPSEPDVMRLLCSLDVLVDGRFEQDKRSYNLRYKGSSNQRLLDVPASLQNGSPIPKQID
ncbi:MAG: anaerobic ribonucleoside-triphosphate reductase activating protein [Ethanoligenens sp.]